MAIRFFVEDGFFRPIGMPRDGALVKLGVDSPREPVSVAVGQNWRIGSDLLLFDSISFASGDTLLVYQIQPSGVPGYGKLKIVRRDKILVDRGVIKGRHPAQGTKQNDRFHHGGVYESILP